MKILILGATGRTGKHLLNEALVRGYDVSVLVRDKSKISVHPEGLTVFEGTSIARNALKKAAQHCEAIVSVLNISRTSDFPWAKLRTPTDFLSQTMRNIIEVSREEQIKRIIVMTAWGVGETRSEIPGWFRWLIENSNIRYPYEDHEKQEELLMQTDLDWTIVRPVGLTNSLKKREITVTLDNQPRPNLTVSRLNAAKFMLDVLENRAFIRQCPVISEK
jgi:uncharacterized protein YbjT (DUF2867 family)